MPIRQWLYYDAAEALPSADKEKGLLPPQEVAPMVSLQSLLDLPAVADLLPTF